MFETLTAPEADKIIRLMGIFAADPRPEKIDLGVGVYRNGQGQTPIMAAVKDAERRIWDAQNSKSYVSLAGDKAYLEAVEELLFSTRGAKATIATPGGTGALRQCFEALKYLRPNLTVWLPEPTWPNHASILRYLGLQVQTYRFRDEATGGLDHAGLLADLAQVAQGDAVVIHGCCHNPTGIEPTPDTWRDIAMTLAKRGALPVIDMAYLGFGSGIEQDRAGLDVICAECPEVLVGFSASKSFGLYRDRVGAVLAQCHSPAIQSEMQGLLTWLNRQNYAFPPDHGARVVQVILDDPELRANWVAELSAMRQEIDANRQCFANDLRQHQMGRLADQIAEQRGMFSLLGLSPDDVRQLRETRGIYLVEDSRVNLAAMTPTASRIVTEAISTLAQAGQSE
ncbi:MAG: aromatic amino acid transaminase [Paracoccaceae bacterium]